MRPRLHYCWTDDVHEDVEIRCDHCARADGKAAERQPEAIHPSIHIGRHVAGLGPVRCDVCRRSYAELAPPEPVS